MSQDENPLDRISSGPAPTGPNPWRSDRLPTGSPYANGPHRGGARRRGLGRAGWITLIVAVAVIAAAIGWAAVSRPDPVVTSPIGGAVGAPADRLPHHDPDVVRPRQRLPVAEAS
ncbi:hypothetical protein [Tsukamurella sp. 1534]|uniref:hypothetical protein n=1 Tax=Tsukamurella sp. 1534 TaxID=1151061 RepID=UPI0002D541DC|nr:hypothetical protein [Tsukamurella sp. 1534]